jgi:hypothetical protein
VILLEAWKEMEIDALKKQLPGANHEFLKAVEQKFPKKIKIKSVGSLSAEDGYELVFPEEEKQLGKSKSRCHFLIITIIF